MNRDAQHVGSRISGAHASVPLEQPRLQQQVDQLNKVTSKLGEQLHSLHLGLDRIQQRPPQPVADRGLNEPGTPARPSIELALAQTIADLEQVAGAAAEALDRLNRMA